MTTDEVCAQVVLPPLPKSYKVADHPVVLNALSQPTVRDIEPVGQGYLHHVRRLLNQLTLSEDEDLEVVLEDADEAAGCDFDRDVYEEATAELQKADPLKWKDHDHYAVMGLGRLRLRATDEDIKQAYRRRVLKHHPDKQAGSAPSGKRRKDEASFFKCIQKSWEILTDPVKRRQFDSVDPTFDEGLPQVPTSASRLDWAAYDELFRPVFVANGRFSSRQPVPELGLEEDSREEVDAFYDFWFNFDSWRTFEWLDEEEGGASDSREDKRYLDKKNRAMRQKRKKEDNARITRLIDLALKYDPRVLRFKSEEREKREAKKREKREAEEQRVLAAKQQELEAAAAAERAAEETRQRESDERAIKKALKEAIRTCKRAVRKDLQAHNWYLAAGDAPAPAFAEMDKRVAEVEKLFEDLTELFEFEYLQKALAAAADWQTKNALFAAIAAEATAKPAGGSIALPEEYAHLKNAKPAVVVPVAAPAAAPVAAPAAAAPEPVAEPSPAASGKNAWTPAQQTQLEAALRRFPASNFKSKPAARWEKIAAEVDGKSAMAIRLRVKELADKVMLKTTGPQSGKRR